MIAADAAGRKERPDDYPKHYRYPASGCRPKKTASEYISKEAMEERGNPGQTFTAY
jgi:hypothetical protein